MRNKIHTFKRQARQGDLLVTRIKSLPEGLVPFQDEIKAGQYVMGHSESGHHHLLPQDECTVLSDPADPFNLYVVVDNAKGDLAELWHDKPEDPVNRHESFGLKKDGIYKVRRQREHTPEGFQRAQD